MKTRINLGQPKSGVPGAKTMPVKWAKTTDFKVPIPRNEKARLQTLRSYEVLDTPAEKAFDNLTALAAMICNTPIALISLVDSERQWFKSKVGLNPSVSETPRDISFCAHAIMQPDVFIVRDATQDPRFAESPLVTSSPKIRFYAGAPIIGPKNHILGMLCVIDRVPRELTEEQQKALEALSRQVMLQLELRRELIDCKRHASTDPSQNRPQA